MTSCFLRAPTMNMTTLFTGDCLLSMLVLGSIPTSQQGHFCDLSGSPPYITLQWCGERWDARQQHITNWHPSSHGVERSSVIPSSKVHYNHPLHVLSIDGDFVPPSVQFGCLATNAAPPKSGDIANETKRGVFHDGDHKLEPTGQSWHQASGVDWLQLERAVKMPP